MCMSLRCWFSKATFITTCGQSVCKRFCTEIHWPAICFDLQKQQHQRNQGRPPFPLLFVFDVLGKEGPFPFPLMSNIQIQSCRWFMRTQQESKRLSLGMQCMVYKLLVNAWVDKVSRPFVCHPHSVHSMQSFFFLTVACSHTTMPQ